MSSQRHIRKPVVSEAHSKTVVSKAYLKSMLGKIVVVYASRFQLLLVLSQTPSFGGQFPYLHCRYLRSGKPPPPPIPPVASFSLCSLGIQKQMRFDFQAAQTKFCHGCEHAYILISMRKLVDLHRLLAARALS